ncbi:LuxR C-terminal-related transcriptional regulator [Oceanobacillus damuensis]|uniref:LuxR C-terminal-related transcriptional regulator n=1 Tax=Oceanobacillus damuensis TaxID=937928 RepID=UPI0008346B05|nr:LuxR C-terminal-related transcriptional regulator [Oceanobacillus damuensis]
MIKTSTFLEKLYEIENVASHEKQIIAVLETYIDIFPVLDAFLCRYSPIGYLGEGIISMQQNEIKYIHDLRYDIRTLPTIMAAINQKQAKFYGDRELFEKTSSNYVIDSNITSFLITPILSGTSVIGFIYSERIENDAEFGEEMLSCLTEFSKQVGLILQAPSYNENDKLLSNREFEVMKKISSGETTKEIAHSLGISELTVKQYVKLAIKKLDASNRVHAVAELFRRGILS